MFAMMLALAHASGDATLPVATPEPRGWFCGWSEAHMARREASLRVPAIVLSPLARWAFLADRIGEYRVDSVDPAGRLDLVPVDVRRGVSAPVHVWVFLRDGDVCTGSGAVAPGDALIVFGEVDRCGDLVVNEGVLMRGGAAYDLGGRPLVSLYPALERAPMCHGFDPQCADSRPPPGTLTRADVGSAIDKAIAEARALE